VARLASDLLREDDARSKRASRHFATVEKRQAALTSSINAPSDRLLQALGYPVKSGAVINSDTALTISSVYACTQIISGIIARLPIRLLQTTASGVEEVRDHAACPLIQLSPDGYRTPFAWRQMIESAALLRGNGFSRIIRNQFFEPVALKWLHPVKVEVWMTADGTPFYRHNGEVLQTTDVFHHKEMSLDGITGLSPVTCMREQMGLAITTQEHGSRYFSNGAAPGIVLMAPLGATKAQMDQIRDEVNKNHGGVANSNKPFVAYGGLTVSTVSLSNQDSQFLESRKFDIEEIARAYRVPLHLLQSTEKTTSWGSGVEQLNRAFVDYSLADRLTRWEQELSMALLTEKDRASGMFFKFDTDELTRGTALERAQTHQIYRNIGVESINDVREAEHMNDLPDNIGDRYDMPFNGNGGTNAADAAQDKAANADTANKQGANK